MCLNEDLSRSHTAQHTSALSSAEDSCDALGLNRPYAEGHWRITHINITNNFNTYLKSMLTIYQHAWDQNLQWSSQRAKCESQIHPLWASCSYTPQPVWEHCRHSCILGKMNPRGFILQQSVRCSYMWKSKRYPESNWRIVVLNLHLHIFVSVNGCVLAWLQARATKHLLFLIILISLLSAVCAHCVPMYVGWVYKYGADELNECDSYIENKRLVNLTCWRELFPLFKKRFNLFPLLLVASPASFMKDKNQSTCWWR